MNAAQQTLPNAQQAVAVAPTHPSTPHPDTA